MKNTKRLVLLAVMVSQALILSIIESWIPIPTTVPGVKLGLANIITIIAIMFLGFKDALLVVIVRCILSSMFGGGLVIFLFSVTGGVLSTVIMSFLYKRLSKVFSILGISVAGSLAHNIGQMGMASIVMKDFAVMAYLPMLMISGVVMGCFVGLTGSYLSVMLKKLNIFP